MINNKPIESYDDELNLDDLQGIAGGMLDGDSNATWVSVYGLKDVTGWDSPFKADPKPLVTIKAGEKFEVYGLPGGSNEQNGMLYTNRVPGCSYCWIRVSDIQLCK